MNLKQPAAPGRSRCPYSACEPISKNKKIIQKFKEAEDSRYAYQNELDKACYQCDMVYGGFKDLHIRTASGKILKHLILQKIEM